MFTQTNTRTHSLTSTPTSGVDTMFAEDVNSKLGNSCLHESEVRFLPVYQNTTKRTHKIYTNLQLLHHTRMHTTKLRRAFSLEAYVFAPFPNTKRKRGFCSSATMLKKGFSFRSHCSVSLLFPFRKSVRSFVSLCKATGQSLRVGVSFVCVSKAPNGNNVHDLSAQAFWNGKFISI